MRNAEIASSEARNSLDDLCTLGKLRCDIDLGRDSGHELVNTAARLCRHAQKPPGQCWCRSATRASRRTAQRRGPSARRQRRESRTRGDAGTGRRRQNDRRTRRTTRDERTTRQATATAQSADRRDDTARAGGQHGATRAERRRGGGVPQRGVAQRHETRSGMRWTRAARLTGDAACGRRRRVVLTPRRWRSSLAEVSARRRWQESPVTGESAL